MYKALNEKRPAKNALTWEEKHKMGYASDFQVELQHLREETRRARSILNSSISENSEKRHREHR